ncbi:MAG: preprotein translocase subunit YajC [Peptococcaceae bacterium]|nr:preprotein translocase subunit YajC [Peptococcaceae bacterium]
MLEKLGNSTMLIYFVILVGITYLMIIRPQQKQRKERENLMNALRVRDKVVTTGGIYGKITKIKDQSVMIEIADKVEIELARAGIASVENRDVAADAANNA